MTSKNHSKSNSLDFDRWGTYITAAQAGDVAAYERLLRELYPFVRSVLQKRLGGIADLDDLTQECLMGVHKSLSSFQPGKPLSPWLFAILRFKIIDYFRRMGRRKETPLPDQLADVTESNIPANTQERPEMAEALRAAMAKLPPSLREAVSLTKFHGLSYPQAAEKAGTSEAALRKRISRAYKALGAQLASTLERKFE